MAVLLFGLVARRAPPIAAMLLSIVVYGFLLWAYSEIAFLNHMAIIVVTIALYIVFW